ncbi:MAG: zinc ribbon domain-containing protein [Ruminococcus sp.]|nr:zinc ribbon domain-containing protein [Ruminococcus sp.]
MVTYDENLLQAEQDKIEKVYTAIGERYYAAHKDDNNSEFPDLMDAIKACEQTMADHKAEVLRQHELMICPSCGAEIYFKSFFCNFCGVRVAYPEGQKPEPEKEPEPEIVTEPEKEPEPEIVTEPETEPVVVVPPYEKETFPVTEEVTEIPQVRTCRSCGYIVTDPEARFCDNCGVPLDDTAAPAVSAASNTKHCPRCGFTTTDPDMLFCIECGHRLEQ